MFEHRFSPPLGLDAKSSTRRVLRTVDFTGISNLKIEPGTRERFGIALILLIQ
jgi:hypothetical protein